MNHLYISLFVPLNGVLMITIYYLMKYFFKDGALNRKTEITSYLSFYFISTALHLLVSIPILNFILSVIMYIIISLNYKSNFKTRMINIFFILFIATIMDAIPVIIIDRVQKSLTNPLIEISSLSLVIGKILFFISGYTLYKFSKNTNNKTDITLKHFLCIIVVPVISLFMFFVIYSIPNYSNNIILIFTISLCAINFIVIYLYDTLTSFFNIRMENIKFEHQLELMKENMDKVHSIKHDMKNQLIVLLALLENNNTYSAKENIQGLISDIHNTTPISNSGNIVIDSIINYKLAKIDKSKFTVIKDIKPVPPLSISTKDISVIVGNIMDNAIEALNNCVSGKIEIKLKIVKNNLTIIITNSYDGTLFIDGENFISKKTGNHGYGIHNVKCIINKYKGILNFEYDKTQFTTKVLIDIKR